MFGETGAVAEDERQLTVDTQLYSHEALFRACYAFTDRCYLFLRENGPSKVTVIFRKRQSPRTLDALVEDFANELISQKVRVQIAAETKSVREMIVAQAFREGDL
jgi:His-Xaa-Ser system protein HxsD